MPDLDSLFKQNNDHFIGHGMILLGSVMSLYAGGVTGYSIPVPELFKHIDLNEAALLATPYIIGGLGAYQICRKNAVSNALKGIFVLEMLSCIVGETIKAYSPNH